MFHSTIHEGAAVPDQDAGPLRVLSDHEIADVSGGFVCGGLCLAGVAFAAGALFGSGVVVGWYSGKRG